MGIAYIANTPVSLASAYEKFGCAVPMDNPFGNSNNQPAENKTPLFGSSNFQLGGTGPSGNAQPNPLSFGSNSQPNMSVFSMQHSAPGSMPGFPASTQPNTSAFGTSSIQTSTGSLFGSTGNQPVGELPKTPSFGFTQDNTANMAGSTGVAPAANLSTGSKPEYSAFGGNTTTMAAADTVDQSTLISSMKENSINLYNLTLQEVVDRHSLGLEMCVRDFQANAQAVFERDLSLIRHKNNYLKIQKKIETETVKLDELAQAIDYFTESIQRIEEGSVTEGGQILKDYEVACERFYKKVEEFKDEQDEVLDLVNENYRLIEDIDRHLDGLEMIKKIK